MTKQQGEHAAQRPQRKVRPGSARATWLAARAARITAKAAQAEPIEKAEVKDVQNAE